MSKSKRRQPSGRTSAEQKARRRNVMVLTGLVGMLTFTSAVLMALAPAPLSPGAATSLFAIDDSNSLEAIFQTRAPVFAENGEPVTGRWRCIYIHHSQTPAGDALTIGEQSPMLGVSDHFVIGNGEGAGDGEIQVGQRWNRQIPAAAPAPGSQIDPSCISICLVGDFDQAQPTSTQFRRLTQLVSTLQTRLSIGRDAVLIVADESTAAGIGRYFPTTAFKEQLPH